MKISLPPDIERYISKKVDCGAYKSADEIIQAAMRLLMKQDELEKLKIEDLRREVQKGLDSLAGSAGVPAPDVLSKLRWETSAASEISADCSKVFFSPEAVIDVEGLKGAIGVGNPDAEVRFAKSMISCVACLPFNFGTKQFWLLPALYTTKQGFYTILYLKKRDTSTVVRVFKSEELVELFPK